MNRRPRRPLRASGPRPRAGAETRKGPPDHAPTHAIFATAKLLAGLTAEDLREAARAFRPRTFSRGAILFHEGHHAGTYYLIGEGQVKILQTSPEGYEVILHILGPGELVGALPTMGEGSYPATAVALVDVLAFAIAPEAFDDLLRRFPQVTLNMLHFAAGVIQVSHRRLREMATERVEQRIARTLARLVRQMGARSPEGITLTAPLSRQDLANLAGTTLFTVSRTLKAWERRGILRAGRGKLTILDPHALIAIGEDLPEHPAPS